MTLKKKVKPEGFIITLLVHLNKRGGLWHLLVSYN